MSGCVYWLHRNEVTAPFFAIWEVDKNGIFAIDVSRKQDDLPLNRVDGGSVENWNKIQSIMKDYRTWHGSHSKIYKVISVSFFSSLLFCSLFSFLGKRGACVCVYVISPSCSFSFFIFVGFFSHSVCDRNNSATMHMANAHVNNVLLAALCGGPFL